jgi:hypothetical protein
MTYIFTSATGQWIHRFESVNHPEQAAAMAHCLGAAFRFMP